ncbi:MAG: NAD-glutamate dehydrogenase [Desulfocapsaceae bacterium]|nr:NAD-glutamate dehydrogenase [Desulfocapsaceae bacterium]
MDTCLHFLPVSQGASIIEKAKSLSLDPSILYEAVIDLTAEGLITANCINLAAGILLNDLGLPNYFFENIAKESLEHILASIASSITLKDGRVVLYGWIAQIDFDLEHKNDVQRVRIATEETRDSMEKMLDSLIPGHRREYYYCPASRYHTYIIRPETVLNYTREQFGQSRFLFRLADASMQPPEPTCLRYERFLAASEKSVIPLIEVFNLPETGETRLMFNSDFASPQLPLLRRMLADHGLVVARAYWESYRGKSDVPASICSLIVRGELSRRQEAELIADLGAFLAFAINRVSNLYLAGQLSFREMLFAGNAVDFTHMFIFREGADGTDREIMENLTDRDHKDAFAGRIHGSNRSAYVYRIILEMVEAHPDLIRRLYALFASRFEPGRADRPSETDLAEKYKEFEKIIASRFLDFSIGYDIFNFMFTMVAGSLKTNFYKAEKRSFSFRFDGRVLDPLVFSQFVYGVFFVNGHYACGTHLRAADIARGGLRLLRVTPSNYPAQLDNAVLLNYALGPKAQRLKHKDICESGSKGVIIPHAIYAAQSRDAVLDYTEGILDLMLGDPRILDYYGRPEMVFFGPDEGTALLMDAVSLHARERGYRNWRTITTGKSFGIPHDTYGRLENGDLFGLLDRREEGVDLQINGASVLVTGDMEAIYSRIGGRIEASGMTTTGVMASFRTLIGHYGAAEEDLNLMMTGGPDGDLGANEIQSYKGRICLVIDGGSVLFDPDGLDRKELMQIAFSRNSSPRANTLAFPLEKLGPRGFRVPITARDVRLPDGSLVADGAVFHRNFLADPDHRELIRAANIQAFIPCGGFKDTVNHGNVKRFLALFQELRFIVEGANVFFDDAARRHIATVTAIKQIKDTTANKGGVFSSSIAEVLTGFLFQDDYEEKLLNHSDTRWELIGNILSLVDAHARAETSMLIRIHEADPAVPLFVLSEQTSENIYALQAVFQEGLERILADAELVWRILLRYVPEVLINRLGRKAITDILATPELKTYRDAIITKKLSSMAFYTHGHRWEAFWAEVHGDFEAAAGKILEAAQE